MDEESRSNALSELQSLTSFGIGLDDARQLLESCDWDLTAAVNQYYERPSTSYPPSAPASSPPSSLLWIRRVIGRILLLPVSLLSSILSIPFTILRFLRRPNPFLSGPPLSPTQASERWKQDVFGELTKDEWYTGKYEDVLRIAKDKKCVMMTVLTSQHHQDYEQFKTVLRDAELADLLNKNDVVCWGGDVRYRDAYLVSGTVQNYSFPCIALTSLTSSSPSNMVILSRIEGQQCLSSLTVQNTITNVLSRVEPFLRRERALVEQRAKERARREQDEQRLRQVAERDTERILKRREEERLRKEREEQEKLKVLERTRRRQEKQRMAIEQDKWRIAMKDQLAKMSPQDGAAQARVGVRMGDGRRITRKFASSDPLSLVYAWVESERPLEVLDSAQSDSFSSNVNAERDYSFKLVSAFPPRKVLELGTTVKEAGLIPDANLVIEFAQSDSSDEDEVEEQ